MRTDDPKPEGRVLSDTPSAAYQRAAYARNPSKAADSNRRWREAHPEQWREIQKRYREADPEAAAARGKAWREANKEKARAYYQANKQKNLEASKRRYAENSEVIKARNREYGARPEVKLRMRERKLAKQYGLTLSDYDTLADQQGRVCASCGGDPNGLGLVVDHDHSTGQVRGLLCSKCNSALGLLDDNEEKVAALLQYIRIKE